MLEIFSDSSVTDSTYDPEAQALFIENFQNRSALRSYEQFLENKGVVFKLGHSWILINDSVLLADHCNMAVFEGLEPKQLIVIIETNEDSDSFTLGKRRHGLAAVLAGDKVLYSSPFFAIERWRRENADLPSVKTCREISPKIGNWRKANL